MRLCAFAVVLVLGGIVAEPASAHGPCGCLKPREGAPGTKVRADYPLYKVIFNPDRTDLAIGPETLWKRHHGGPPITIFRQTWRYSVRPLNRGATFVIPRVAPGRYLIVLYDGGEGGSHYSWQTFEVLPAGRNAAKPAAELRAPSTGVAIPLFIGALLVALFGGMATGAILRGARRPGTR